MDIGPVAVYYYQTASGKCPYKQWFESLDESVQQIVDARLARVRRGLLGRAENLGQGVSELKFDVGPGFRIYYGKAGKAVVILLHGGDKKGQSDDIETAREYWADYLRRTKK